MFLEDFELRGMITEHLFLRRHPQNRPQGRQMEAGEGSKEVTVIDEAREEGDLDSVVTSEYDNWSDSLCILKDRTTVKFTSMDQCKEKKKSRMTLDLKVITWKKEIVIG